MPASRSPRTKKSTPPAKASPPADRAKSIVIRGARTHNLKGVDCEIPQGHLTVVTGVSGSGKSSLAFDTLFAEGQRRYVESLSTYARQFIERMPRPDVDSIDHIPPAIALEQKNSVKNARSTIGTATEINDYLRLLYAKIGRLRCPDCDEAVRRDTPQSALERLRDRGWTDGTRLFALAPVELDTPALFPAVLDEMRRQGYTRLWIEGRTVDTTDPAERAALPEALAAFAVVIDRLVVRDTDDDRARLVGAVEAAFRLGKGRAVLQTPEGERLPLFESLTCRKCQRVFRSPEPALFSFYNPLGACKHCQGFGRATGLDMDKVIPNPGLTLAEGLVAPWNTPANLEMYDLLRSHRKLGIPWDVPFAAMTPKQRRLLVEGEGKWPGIRGFFGWIERRRYRVQNRILLARYRGFTTCPECHGARLVSEALWWRVSDRTLPEIWALSVRDLRRWFREGIRLTPVEAQTAELLLREIHSRLDYLDEVGLGYLTLDRQTRTLSGGESQRINLATALGSALTETLYVLDEPTVGLHPRDTARLIGVLRRLVGLGNTVVVVEHDLDVIREADRLIDLGPRAGEHGGEVVFQGPPSEAAARANGRSATARYLLAPPPPATPGRATPAAPEATTKKAPGRNKKKGMEEAKSSLESRKVLANTAVDQVNEVKAPGWSQPDRVGAEAKTEWRLSSPAVGVARRRPRQWISVLGACENNLRHLNVEIPLRVLTCVTGVSGSGKTTLVQRCLYGNYRRAKGDSEAEAGKILRLEGLEALDDMVFVDQSPIGRSTRSNPATYLKAWDGVRDLFASSREARRKGLRPRDFSFNVEGGRCEVCQGTGTQTIDMQFLADVTVTCEQCEGARFQDRILDVRHDGLTITQTLDLTIDEAVGRFAGHPKIVRGLAPLAEVGLGYLRLGQSTATLSGGEAQRLKLASHLAGAQKSEGATLLLFDEPTTGLHPADLEVLLGVFDRLLDKGFSIVVIEHNLELIARADWVIDLGPEGGDAGGDVIATGTPEAVATHRDSHTAHHLRDRLAGCPI